MQYMLAFLETAPVFADRTDPAASAPYWGSWSAYMGEMGKAGIIRSGTALQDPATGSFLRIRDGRQHVQDGPTPESKEMLGGFVVIEVADLDAALGWAAKAPCAATGSVEVRPVLPMNGM